MIWLFSNGKGEQQVRMHYGLSLQWRHNGRDSVSNHQPHDCLLNRLLRRRSKKTSKLRVTGLGAGNSPGTGEFPAQLASNAENASIWWRHHDIIHYHDLIDMSVNHDNISTTDSRIQVYISSDTKWHIKAPHYWHFLREFHLHFHHKRPVIP